MPNIINTTKSIKRNPVLEAIPDTVSLCQSRDLGEDINDAGHRVTYTPHEDPEYNPGPDDPEAEDEPDRAGNTEPDGDLNGSD